MPCGNSLTSNPQEVKVLHLNSYLHKSAVLSAITIKNTHSAENWPWD